MQGLPSRKYHGTDERSKGRRKAVAGHKLVLIMLCKEEEDEVSLSFL